MTKVGAYAPFVIGHNVAALGGAVAGGGGGGGGGGGSLPVKDSFTRADSVSAIGSSPTSHTWVANAGTWGITGKSAYLATNYTVGTTRDANATIDTAATNVTIDVDITTAQAGNSVGAGIIFRYVDQSNFFGFMFYRTGGGALFWYLFKNVAGVNTVLNNVSVAAITGSLRVMDDGTNIIVSVNGSIVYATTDTALNTATKQGIFAEYTTAGGANDGTGWRFDNFNVSVRGFSDLFNRSNRNLNGDNGWGGSVTFGSINIVSNQALSSTASNGIWLINSGNSVSNTNHWAEVDVAAMPVGSIGGVVIRFVDANNFINFVYDNYSATKQFILQKRIGSVYTTLGVSVEALPSLPFRMRVEVNGTVVIASVNTGSGWVMKVMATVTDAAIVNGTPGMFFQNVTTDPTLDNYQHGNTYTPLFADDYTRSNGPLGSNYQGHGGAVDATISSGTVIWGSLNTQMNYVNPLTTDHFVEFDLTAYGGASDLAALLAVTPGGTNSYYYAGIDGGALFIYKYNPSGSTLATATLASIGLNTTTMLGKRLRAERQGSAIRLYIGGVLAVSATDATLTGQYGGFRIGASGNALDNFRVGIL